MRRADEALGRQSAQAHGPSFVEAQDREFARQASEQLSSKKSCECEGREWREGKGREGREGHAVLRCAVLCVGVTALTRLSSGRSCIRKQPMPPLALTGALPALFPMHPAACLQSAAPRPSRALPRLMTWSRALTAGADFCGRWLQLSVRGAGMA